jgi:hypothetical protein
MSVVANKHDFPGVAERGASVRELVRLTWMCFRAADREASPEYLDVVRGTRTPAMPGDGDSVKRGYGK